MKNLKDYILEAEEIKDDSQDQSQEKNNIKPYIKYTIWEAPDKKVLELNDNNDYQKIEYKYYDKEKGIEIDFLLGLLENNWQLWVGKLGSCSYDDEPYFNFNTDNFKKAIVMSLDTIEEFINKVIEDPQNYVQYYKLQ